MARTVFSLAGGRGSSPTTSRSHHNTLSALLFLTPLVVIMGPFNLFPAFYSLFLSLFEWNGVAPTKAFVALDNYSRLLSSSEFWNSLRVTVVYAASITVGALVLGLAAALMLNSSISGRTVYRAVYFLPVITPMVAAGVVWTYLFDPSQGVINRMLAFAGISGPDWLTAPATALWSVVIVGIWKRVGFNLVVYLAALQTIPKSYYEAAYIEGAGGFATFRFITLPLLGASTFFLIVTSLIEAFQVFDLAYVMTGGGPLRSTDVMGYFLYRYGFRYYEIGYASSIAYVMFFLLFVATVLQFSVSGRGARR